MPASLPPIFYAFGGSLFSASTPVAYQVIRANAGATAYELVTVYSRSEADSTFATLDSLADKANLSGGNSIYGTQSFLNSSDATTASINSQTGVISGVGTGLTSIPNSATTATSANTASAIVARGASGEFSCGAITCGAITPAGTASFGKGYAFRLRNVSNDSYGANFYNSGATTGDAILRISDFSSGSAIRVLIGAGTDDTVNRLQVGGGILATTLNLGGATVTDIISATASLAFDATDPHDLTITVTGAALGDTVAIGVQHGSVGSNNVFYGWVSATDTVTIRKTGSADPATGTFRATVLKI